MHAPSAPRGFDFRAALVALAVLLGLELGVVRSGYVWKRAPNSMVGAFYGVEREVLATAPPPTVIFMGSSRMRDAVAPRQLEGALGLPRGAVLNLGLTGGTPFEARLFYARHRDLLRRGQLLIVGVEDWYWNEGFPHDEVERQFATLATRWQWFQRSRQLGDLVGGVWRTVELQDPLGRFLMSFAKGVKPVTFDEGRMRWRALADVRQIGPESSDVAFAVEHGMQSLKLGPAYEADLRALIGEARADGLRVVLTQLPLRATYCDELAHRYPAVVPYMRNRIEAMGAETGAEVVFYERGTTLGIADDRFYDYGHLTEDGVKRMTAVWAEHLTQLRR